MTAADRLRGALRLLRPVAELLVDVVLPVVDDVEPVVHALARLAATAGPEPSQAADAWPA